MNFFFWDMKLRVFSVKFTNYLLKKTTEKISKFILRIFQGTESRLFLVEDKHPIKVKDLHWTE